MDKVTSKATQKVYARKRINKKKMFGHDARAQKIYENEIKALNKVASHDHLIKVRATYTDKKYLVMLLQPVADMNLKQYMTKVPLTGQQELARFQTYFGCLAHTIRFLHEPHIGIIHKDIKPENVLLNKGHLILTDFGTAFDWSSTGQSMTRRNEGDSRTPRYQSPEVAHASEFHRSSDIWSLGVLFLEMVIVLRGKTLSEMDVFLSKHGTGRIAVHENTEGAMKWFEPLQASSTGQYSDNEPLAWIKQMLNRSHINRPSATDLCEEIAAFNDGMFCCHDCLGEDSDSESEGISVRGDEIHSNGDEQDIGLCDAEVHYATGPYDETSKKSEQIEDVHTGLILPIGTACDFM